MLQYFLVALAMFVAAAALWLLLMLVAVRRHLRAAPNPQPDPEVSVLLRTASVATELVPRFDALISEGDEARLTITGGSGDYAEVAARQASQPGAEPGDPNNGLWCNSLRRWLSRGTHINYVLAAPTEEGVAVLGRLEADYPGRFRLFLLSEECFESEEDRLNVRELVSFHPCLLENASTGRRAMWIENRHPPGTTIAHDVEYVAPADTRGDIRFDALKAFLSRYISNSMRRADFGGEQGVLATS